MSQTHAAESPLEVVFEHFHARGSGDVDRVRATLHPDMVQQGVLPELVCQGRDAVLERMRHNMERLHGSIDWLELWERGDRVVAGVAGRAFAGNPLLPDGRLFMVFTVRDGVITRTDDFRTREEAVRAAESQE